MLLLGITLYFKVYGIYGIHNDAFIIQTRVKVCKLYLISIFINERPFIYYYSNLKKRYLYSNK